MRLETRESVMPDADQARAILASRHPDDPVVEAMIQEWLFLTHSELNKAEFHLNLSIRENRIFSIRLMHHWAYFARKCLRYSPELTAEVQERLSRFPRTFSMSHAMTPQFMDVFIDKRWPRDSSWVRGALWTAPVAHVWTNGQVMYVTLKDGINALMRAFTVIQHWAGAENRIFCEPRAHQWILGPQGYRSSSGHILDNCDLLMNAKVHPMEMETYPDFFEKTDTITMVGTTERVDRLVWDGVNFACPKCGHPLRGEIQYAEPSEVQDPGNQS